MNLKIKATIEKRNPSEPSILEGGLLKIKPASVDYAKLIVNELKGYKGTPIEIAFNDTESWSDKTNNLFHLLVRKLLNSGMCPYWDMLRKSPNTFEEVKAFCKIQFGGAKVEKVGELSWIESWKNFTKTRSAQTIDNIIMFMIDLGIDVDSEKLEIDSIRS